MSTPSGDLTVTIPASHRQMVAKALLKPTPYTGRQSAAAVRVAADLIDRNAQDVVAAVLPAPSTAGADGLREIVDRDRDRVTTWDLARDGVREGVGICVTPSWDDDGGMTVHLRHDQALQLAADLLAAARESEADA